MDNKRLLPVFSDARGDIFDLVDGEDIRHVTLITSKKGVIRGNHFHRTFKQINYVLEGKVELVARKDGSDVEKRRMMVEGDIVTIPEGTTHAFKTLVDSKIIEFSSKAWEDMKDDVHVEELIR